MEKIILQIFAFNLVLLIQIWHAETFRQPFKDEQPRVFVTEDGYRTYYLSSNGTDVSTCGKTMYTACKTLEYVLSLYYKTTDPPEKGLEIITSKSLVIDAPLMAKHQAFRRSYVKISSLETELTANRLSVPTIGVEGVDFLDSNWELSNVNVNMIKTNASLMTLKAFSSEGNYSENHEPNVHVDKCIFGQWILMGISNITITNSSSIDLNIEREKVILSISNSTVWMENITIQGIDRTNIIEVNSGSIIFIRRSTFLENKPGCGVINLANQSFLTIDDCHFQGNKALDLGGAVHLSNSIVQIENSRFENNSAYMGGAIYFNQSTLQMNNSNFTQNMASFGGAVCGENNVDVKITNSHFLSNVATGGHQELSKSQRLQQAERSKSAIYLPTSPASKSYSSTVETLVTEQPGFLLIVNGGGAISCMDNCNLSCSDTIFVGNIATKDGIYNKSLYEPIFVGGAISVYNYSTLNAFNVTFRQNGVRDWSVGGAISAFILSSVNLENSLLEDNTAFSGGGVWAQIDSIVVIKQSEFINNSAARLGGAVATWFSSKLNVTSSTFQFNHAIYAAGAVSVSYNSVATITFCTFAKNSMKVLYGAAIWVTDFSPLHVSNTSFIQNMKETGGEWKGGTLTLVNSSNVEIDNCLFSGNIISAIETTNCTLNVTNSIFIHNSRSDAGAALNIWLTFLYLKNVTFYQNTAGSGGAVAASSQGKMTIIDSVFQGNAADRLGGAIYVQDNTSVLIYNTNFTNNKAKDSGGAIFTSGFVDLFMSSCSLDENYSGNMGGAIFLALSSNNIFELCKFNLNKAETGGGAITLSRANFQARNAYFENNLATRNSGGAIVVYDNSIINISDSNFLGNKVLTSGSGGAIAIATNATAYLSNIVFVNNSADKNGAALVLQASNIYLNRSKFESNSAERSGGAIYLRDHSLASVENSVFRNNSATADGSVYVEVSEAHFEKCLFDRNVAKAQFVVLTGGALMVRDANVSISYSDLSNNSAKCGEAIYADTDTQTMIYTYMSSFTSTKNVTLNSSEPNFVQKAEKYNIIYLDRKPALIEETPYASVIPRKCLHDCLCYHSVNDGANVFNCNKRNLTHLPKTVVNGTDWFVATENSFGEIREVTEYLSDVIHIDLSSSHVSGISDNVMTPLLEKTVYLNIENNNLTHLPKSIAESLNVTNLLISNNPYECNCDMMWMRDWLVQATNVKDKENVICATGKWKGVPIYKLDNKKMGCIFPLWAIITIAAGSVTIIILAIVLVKKWEAIKFFMFMHFNYLINDDGPENLDEIDFDAFVTYSHHDRPFVKTEVLEYLENEFGFKLCVHERDFMLGETIPANIEVAIKHSRRMIMVISRNYIHSEWCMTEFRIAHQLVQEGQTKFLIPLLYEDVDPDELDADIKLYIETHTYTDCKDLEVMRKRLRYAMPRVALREHRQEQEQEAEPEENAAAEVLRGAAAAMVTNVGIMAKRIGEAERKKRRGYRRPPERPLGGDIETSESESEGSDDENASNEGLLVN